MPGRQISPNQRMSLKIWLELKLGTELLFDSYYPIFSQFCAELFNFFCFFVEQPFFAMTICVSEKFDTGETLACQKYSWGSPHS